MPHHAAHHGGTHMAIAETPGLISLDLFFGEIFGMYTDVWYYDWKIWGGAAMLASFYYLQNQGKEHLYTSRYVEICGLDLILLSLVQQHGRLGLGLSALIICLHSTGNTILRMVRAFQQKPARLPNFTASNIYQDLAQDFLKVVTVCFSQVALCYIFFCGFLFMEMSEDNFSYSFWFVSVIGIQLGACYGRGIDSQLGSSFYDKLWIPLVSHCSQSTFTHKLRKDSFTVTPIIMWIRLLMAFFVNEALRNMVGISVPIFLMQSSSPMDFVMNCLAFAYIFTIDESTGVSYEIEYAAPDDNLSDLESQISYEKEALTALESDHNRSRSVLTAPRSSR